MADGDLTRLIVTYTYICFSKHSSKGRPLAFGIFGMLPYRYMLFAIPRLRYLSYTRLLSMPGLSTSELLRTL